MVARHAFMILMIWFGFLPENRLIGQAINLGTPPVFSFSKKDTHGGTQTWDIEDDGMGNTWFANNAGVLRFDGSSWQLYVLPSGTIVRSIALGKDGIVYAGGQGEFGYFTPDKNGIYRFTSLSAHLGENDRVFGDVWQIIVYGNSTFFRTDHQLFIFDGKQVSTVYKENVNLNFTGVMGQNLVLQDDQNRFFVFNGRDFSTPLSPPVFNMGKISSAINLTPDTVLLTTIDRGIFYLSSGKFGVWKTPYDDRFRGQIIYCAGMAGPDEIVLGSSFAGVNILDRQRRLTYAVSKENGLPNNTILSVCGTSKGNVWVGTDNGIALINLSAPVRYIYPDGALEGTGYDALLHDNYLYLGTNTGLYGIEWKKSYSTADKSGFRPVANSSGQVWGIQADSDQVLMGHHNGAFVVKGMTATRMHNSPPGVWKFIRSANGNLLTGHYGGISYSPDVVPGIDTKFEQSSVKLSSRFLYRGKDGIIWMAHPYRGIFKVVGNTTDGFRPEKFNDGKLSALANMIFQSRNEIIVHDDTSFYRILSDGISMAPYELLTKHIVRPGSLKFLQEDKFGNIWYATADETAMLVPDEGFDISYRKHRISFFNGLLPEGFQKVYVIDNENVLLPSEKGFVHFNPRMYLKDTSAFRIHLAGMSIEKTVDSVLFSSVSCLSQVPESFRFGPADQNLSFRFATCDNADFDHVMIRYTLSGINPEWTSWSADPVIKFNNLAPGTYTLTVEAQNGFGKISKPVSVRFSIAPPWYRSVAAYVCYSLLLLSLLAYLFKSQDKRHRRDKIRIQSENEMKEMVYLQQAELSQSEINKLRNEKLEAEINIKNSELTSYTYHLVSKNDLIQKIREQLAILDQKFHDHGELRKELKNISRLIESNEEIDDDWDNFIKSFDQVHADFYKRLNEKFSDLSPTDYKMCTYLRMNLTSKEIASLMNISVRSVETNRYRLRKKLDLEHDENLTQFILKF